MRHKKNEVPERKPHPDGRIELKLQRVASLQQAVQRQVALVKDYRLQMVSARDEQENHGHRLRNSNEGQPAREAYQLGMAEQEKRMAMAQAGIATAEETIEALHEQIAKLTAELSDSDLAWL
jgi:hypothetical protein